MSEEKSKRRASGRDGVFMRNGHFFISWQDLNGKRKKRKTAAQTLQEARSIRAAEMAKVEKARVLGFIPPTEKTFETVSAEFLQKQATRLTAVIHGRQSEIFRLHLNPYFTGPLAAIKHGKIENYLIKRHREEAAPATIRKELQILKQMMEFCVLHEYLPASPAVHVKGPKVKETEAAFVPKEQFPALLAQCPGWLQPIVTFATATGFRRQNILKLEWRDVDIENRLVMLRGTKTEDLQPFALNDLAIAVLKFMAAGVKTESRAKVFSYVGSETNVSVRFKRAAKKAGIPNVHFHSLRHTFGSWAVMNGNELSAVQRWMGHKTPRMTARYAHLSPAFMRRELERLNGAFADVTPLVSGDVQGTNEAGNVSTPVTLSHRAKQLETRMNTEENVQVADVPIV